MRRGAPVVLPDTCDTCRRTGGLWVPTPEGMGRCGCERGQALEMGIPKYRKMLRKEAVRQKRLAGIVDGKAEAGRSFD